MKTDQTEIRTRPLQTEEGVDFQINLKTFEVTPDVGNSNLLTEVLEHLVLDSIHFVLHDLQLDLPF